MQWGALYLSFEYDSFFKSIKKASIFIKNYKDKNEQHFQILKVLFLCGFCGDCILTRGLTESVLFAPKPRAGLRRRALPVADAARRGWRSGQNMAVLRHILGTARGVAKQLQVRLYILDNLVGIIIAFVLRRFHLFFLYILNYGARSFPYAVFSFSYRFLFTLCHTIHPIRLVHHQKSINHNSNSFVMPISISVFRLT